MPYLRAHLEATRDLAINPLEADTEADALAAEASKASKAAAAAAASRAAAVSREGGAAALFVRTPYFVHRYGPHPEQFLRIHSPWARARQPTGTTGRIDSSGGGSGGGGDDTARGTGETINCGEGSEDGEDASAAPRETDAGPRGVMVLVHGGFWDVDASVATAAPTSLAPALARSGWAVVEVEYRRREHPGGGFLGSNLDVAGALKSLPKAFRKLREFELEAAQETGFQIGEGTAAPIDPGGLPIVVVGHGTGGTMGLWLTHQRALFRKAYAKLFPTLVVAIAPVTDLRLAAALNLSEGAVNGHHVHNFASHEFLIVFGV